MWGWICAGGAVLLIGWIVLRARLYRRLFADEHFLEVARAMGRLKAAALGKVIVSPEDEVHSPADPRVLITSAGLVLLYTIRQMGSQFVHHYSVSVAGGYTAHAVGEAFVLFVARLLGVPYEELALGIGPSTVHHAELQLEEQEHAELAERPIPELTLADIQAFRVECFQIRKRLRWQRLDAGKA